MRHDKLVTTTQGIRGNKKHSNVQGMTRLSVSKGFNEPENVIIVDTYKGYEKSYQPRETAIVDISFADGKQFSGTFDELKDKLFPPTPLEQARKEFIKEIKG